MAPSTALVLLILGGALLLRQRWGEKTAVRLIGFVAAGIAAAPAVITGLQHVTGVDLVWEAWLLRTDDIVRGIPVGLMSPLSAGAFLLAAISLAALFWPLTGRRLFVRVGLVTAALGAGGSIIIALAYATGTPLFYGGGIIPMAMLTAVGLAALNLALLTAAVTEVRRRAEGAGAPRLHSTPSWRAAERNLLIVFGALALGIGLAGFFALRVQQRVMRERITGELQAIANLKVGQIMNWRNERLADARQLKQTPSLARNAAALFVHPDSAATSAEMFAYIREMRSNYRYEAVVLFDQRMNPRLAVPPLPVTVGPRLQALLEAVPQADDVLVSDLNHRVSGGIYMDLVAPLRDFVASPLGQNSASTQSSATPIGAMLLRIDPRDFLYPLIQQWPLPSETAETLLVRREGDEVVYLNDLRHRPGTALTLRRSVYDQQLPAGRGARGTFGVTEGVGYRGVAVLAAVEVVPGSPWILVAQVDQSEIYAPLRRQALAMGAIVTSLLLGGALGVAYLSRQASANFLSRELVAEVERRSLAERLAMVTRHANDIILLADETGRILDANDRTLAAYGYTLDELRRLPPNGLRAPAAAENLPQHIELLSSLEGAVFETVHIRKDGSTFPVEVSGRLVAIEGRQCRLAIIRDITERNHAEAALRESEQKYRELVEHANSIILRWTRDGKITFLNEFGQKFFGYAEAEILGRHVVGTIVPASESNHQDQRRMIEQIRARPEAFEQNVNENMRHNGERVWVAWANKLVLDERGQVKEILSVGSDITGRKQADEALVASELRYRRLFESAKDGILILDAETGMVVDVNPFLIERLGFSHAQFLGKKVWELGFFKDIIANQASFAALQQNKYVRYEDKPLETADGRRIDVEFVSNVYLVNHQKVIQCNIRDITERKRAQKALQEAEAKFHSIFDHAIDGIYQTTPEGTFLTANPAMARILGYASAEELITQRTDIAQQGYAVPARREEFKRVMARDSIVEGFEYEVICGDGSRKWVSENARAVRDAHGSVLFFEGSFEDITERKHAEAALRQSEELYRSLFGNMLNGYAYCRMIFADGQPVDFVPLVVNPAFTTLLGLKDVVGKNASVVIPGLRESDPKLLEVFGRVALSGVPEQFEHFGKILGVWLSLSVYSPAKEHVVVVFDVITERKQAEAALRESEERFRSFFENAPIGKCITAPDGKFLRANRALGTMLGYSVGELETFSFAAITHPADVAESRAGVRAMLAGERDDWSTEKRYRAKDGRYVWAHVTTRLQRDDQGRPLHFLTHIVDVTASKTAELALRESEARYRLLFEDNPLPMWAFDAETLRIMAVNESAVQHYGYTREEFRRLTAGQLHPPEDAANILKILEGGRTESKRFGEWRHRKKDGTNINVEVYSNPIKFDGRNARLVLVNDITEKKLLEEKFLHAQRLESLGMLAAGIAHDLNNVLAPIVFAAPLLRNSLTTPRDLKILETLERSAGRGAGLVRQILAFAHNTTGEIQTTQVKHLMRDVMGVIEETFPKSIRFEHQIPSDLWPVTGNPTQIHQVLMNLCVNARDAMPQGGTLCLNAANRRIEPAEVGAIPGALPGAWLVIEVSDTGTGIPLEVRDRIWTPFFTTKVAGKGTGLGLSTVRGIVAGHHGFVELQTEVGRGTTFRVFLPAVVSEVPRPASASPFGVLIGHGELILLVDDDAAIREVVTAILGRNGYRIVSCVDGVEAIANFTALGDTVDLVITDVDMPRLGGVALCRALSQMRPDIRLLAISGLSRAESDVSDIPEIRMLAHAFLLKPFSPEAILGAVHRLLHPTART